MEPPPLFCRALRELGFIGNIKIDLVRGAKGGVPVKCEANMLCLVTEEGKRFLPVEDISEIHVREAGLEQTVPGTLHGKKGWLGQYVLKGDPAMLQVALD